MQSKDHTTKLIVTGGLRELLNPKDAIDQFIIKTNLPISVYTSIYCSREFVIIIACYKIIFRSGLGRDTCHIF